MYLSFYGLKREPFHITPDPDFLYLSPSHKEAVGAIIYGVKQRKGFIKVTGEPGTGKTTILRSYINEIKGERIHPLYLFVPGLRYKDILRTIVKGMKIETEASSTTDLLSAIHWGLIELYKKGHLLVLIIDEAQQMSVETLEQLRLLANLETTKEKLLQIVLCGQPEFDEMLQIKELRQLRQRIAVRTVINPLNRRESVEYIRHRLRAAGCERDSIFTPAAEQMIVAYANGSPRVINICCDNVLVAGYAKQADTIGWGLVRRVIQDLESDVHKSWIPKRALAGIAAVAALALLFAGGVWYGRGLNTEAAAPIGNVLSGDRVSLEEPAFATTAPLELPIAETPLNLPETATSVIGVELASDDSVAGAMATTTSLTPETSLTHVVWSAEPGQTLEDILRHVHGEATPALIERALTINPGLSAGDPLADDQKVNIPESGVFAATTAEGGTES